MNFLAEVNWMGLDVDDASDKESEGEELLNYEQGRAVGSEVQSDMWTDEMVFNVTFAIWMRAIKNEVQSDLWMNFLKNSC